jgi:REP element-mobilizing transposase RayT
MPRRARVLLPGVTLHLIQRGNNRSVCFFADEDYLFYLEHLGAQARKHGCVIHAWCLMANHVHLLLTPAKPVRQQCMPNPAKKMLGVTRQQFKWIAREYLTA